MKIFIGLATLVIVYGCGILSFVFDQPERYIAREVITGEMLGTWSITPDSEAEVTQFVQKYPDWGVPAPWKSITLNEDGSCDVKLEIGWLGAASVSPTESYSKSVISNDITSCSWGLAKDENTSGKTSSVVKLALEYLGNYSALYSLYIVEENGGLILWNFIGDPDDFRMQDFVITK